MSLREDDVAPRSGPVGRRILLQAGGFVLAVAATLVVFLTEDPQVLRLAVVGVAWAFVLATFAAAGRSSERIAARAREDELRRAYEHELDQEVAARREYELELRRETEDSVRAELDALRDELAGLHGMRAELARVAEVRIDVAAVAALRDEVARIAALRDEVSVLGSLRQDLGQLGELRGEMARLRAELTEQLSSEMLVERIVMRTQAGRLTAEVQGSPDRALDAASRWGDDATPPELSGGWPAVRLDASRETRQFDQVRVERTSRPPHPPTPAPPARPWDVPATATWETVATPSREAPATTAWDAQDLGHRSPESRSPSAPVAGRSREEDRWSFEDRSGPPTGSVPVPATTRPDPGPAPRTTEAPEWPAARSRDEAEPTSFRPGVPLRRRRGDEAPVDPLAAPTTQRPVVAPNPPIRVDDRGGHRVAVHGEQPAEPPAGPPRSTSQEKRLADILAENDVSPTAGGRRRRRYRDDDEPDDVLARVLRNE